MGCPNGEYVGLNRNPGPTDVDFKCNERGAITLHPPADSGA